VTREQGLRAALRVTAVLIAVAAAIDPVVTRMRPAPQSVVVVRLASVDVTSVERALSEVLPGANITVRSPGAGRLPCAPGESCVAVSDGSVDVSIPDDLTAPLSLIHLSVAGGSNVAVQSVGASASQHAAAAGTVRVVMVGTGMAGRRTELRVTDGSATVGSATHDWKADGDVTLDIPWWPLAGGPRALRVAASPFEGEASALDNAVDVGVQVSSERAAVLVFDARPSWASTFVRRALEDDPRFQVEHRVGLGPALAAGTAGGRLDSRALDAAAVTIVGSPESLSANEVSLLERFVQTRGGTLLLLPDRAPAGPAARLFAGRWTEHLEATASPAGVLQASETLRLAAASPFDLVLGSAKGRPVMVLSPSGNGRVVVSGAMDAWRYRDVDGGTFDRFWRSLVLQSAAASTPLTISFTSSITRPGTAAAFVVRHLRMDPVTATEVLATATCGDHASAAIRVWPSGQNGVFTGTMPVEGDEPCRLRVSIDGGPSAEGGVAVTAGMTRSVADVRLKLERAATRSGGVVVNAGDEGTVATALAPRMSAAALSHPVRPMRSPWWMFPFVTLLGVEWWLRRRSRLR